MLTYVVLCLCMMTSFPNEAKTNSLQPTSYISRSGQVFADYRVDNNIRKKRALRKMESAVPAVKEGLKYMQGMQAEKQLLKDADFQYFSSDSTRVYSKIGGYWNALRDFFATSPSFVVDLENEVGKMGKVGNRIIFLHDHGAVSTIFIRETTQMKNAYPDSVLIIYNKMPSI